MTQHQENPQYKHSDLIVRFPREREDWRDAFHSIEDFENAPPISFAIDGFLQNDGATLIAGLSGHGKTLVMLSLVKALFAGKGTKLWGQFDALETAFRVVYLIPECTITKCPFIRLMKT
jgi:RecA-family ATPase